MAISSEPRNLSQSKAVTDPTQNAVSQRVRELAAQIPQALTPRQFATLHAVLDRLIHHPQAHQAVRLDADLAGGGSSSLTSRSCPAALDTLETLSQAHTDHAFADLTPELQDIILDFIATGRLTAKYPSLEPWLEDLRAATTQSLAA